MCDLKALDLSVSVVIPALNEQFAITETVKTIMLALSDAGIFDIEIIVVDDGSVDETGELARQAGAVVITNPHNIGYGFALKTGILAARFDTIVITDADGTYPIERIPRLLSEYQKGFNLVVGARAGRHYRESLLKMPLRILLRWLVEFVVGQRITDINSGLRVFSRQAIIPYFDQLCDTFSFTTSMTLAYVMTKKFIYYVPIDYRKRVGQTKVRLFKDSLRTLQYIIQAIIYYNPLKMFVVLCLLVMLLALLSLILAIFTETSGLLFLGFGCILATPILFSMGLLADLLRQIMLKQ
ncbi:MAG: glycosyltransferase family 2 protein [Spirulinaceae cyanobacterium SM2_1_0]|nr:glycosyltransferase family 2 protein [Spirulinaceae cyanobacterium SM2_1_0]